MNGWLPAALIETGMLETGIFQRGNLRSPFRLRLDMLPSYPDVLSALADDALTHINSLEVDRLVCPVDAVPFGTAVSMKSGIPLVYSRGKGESAVYDLVGAYDVGHPACLLLNVLDCAECVQTLQRSAKSVGLNIRHVLAIIDTETVQLADTDCQSIITLSAIAQALHRVELMTSLQLSAIRKWQAQQRS